MKPRGGLPRPTKAAGPILGSVLALLGWAAVAHNSGSGWVQALGSLLAGFVVVGLGGPAIATARLSVSVLSNPADSTVGVPVTIELKTNAPLRVHALQPAGPSVVAGAGSVFVELVAARRGPIGEVSMRVGSAAPFGMLWWHKRVVVGLAREMWAGPRVGLPDPTLVTGSASGAQLDRQRPRDARVGEPRGVRPYVGGDPRRLVHWPATAHRGELMVREAERAEDSVPEVRVSLPDDGPDGDAVAERALGTILVLLARSSPVMLATIEREGPRVEAVYSPTDASRRLARAVAHPGQAR